MTPSEADFAALRARVDRLEAELKMLGGNREHRPIVPEKAEPTLAVSAEKIPTEPPLVPPPLPLSGGGVGMMTSQVAPTARREATSAVWIAGVGAVIFLIGAIYGLTVSIQRGWISPPVRVGVGLGLGVGLGRGAFRQLVRGQRGLGVALLAAGVGTWTFAWYFGSHEAKLFSPVAGLVGTSGATLLAGWIAARVRSDGSLAVALAVGLAAPLAFSNGQGSVPTLLVYLLVLSGSQVAVNYLVRAGADWDWSRLLGLVGIWLVVLAGVAGGRVEAAPPILGLLGLLAVVGLALTWLPGHPEKPHWPGAATISTLSGAALASWLGWVRVHWEREDFSVVLLVLAAVSMALVPAGRKRSPAGAHDLPLLLAALGFTFVAMAMALDWRWIVVAWGVLAALVASATRIAQQRARVETETLQVVTVVAATIAAMVWLGLVFDQAEPDAIFVNRVFAGAVLTSVAWALLASTPGRLRALAMVALQVVAVNAFAWELARAVPAMHSENATLAIGPLLATLTYALVGAGLWLRGVATSESPGAKLLRICGYGWLAVAAIKLLVSDMARTDLLFRAAAALGVGAILILAAWWASQRRSE